MMAHAGPSVNRKNKNIFLSAFDSVRQLDVSLHEVVRKGGKMAMPERIDRSQQIAADFPPQRRVQNALSQRIEKDLVSMRWESAF